MASHDQEYFRPLWDEFDGTSDVTRQHEIVDQIQKDFLETLYQIPMYRFFSFHAWWPAVRNMPRTGCCTVDDMVEDMERVWIDRDFRPFGDLIESDGPNA